MNRTLSMMFRAVVLAFCCCQFATLAQRGDRRGEVQAPLPDHLKAPPSPPLPPDEAIKTIQAAPGFRVELFASEPMVQDPVAITFDEDGRMFVVEMRGFMPDIDGRGENEPIGRISLLEDTDGDGRADKSSVFLDDLVLPRAAAYANGGLLFCADGKLSFAQDRDGDGKADETGIVDAQYVVGGSPEHQPNGLLPGIDNWYYNAKSSFRYRRLNGKWVKERTEFRGQWGITQDDFGRLFHNVNDSQLHGDLIAPNYLLRNENFWSTEGINLLVATNQQVFPIRMNTAINRAYRGGILDERGRAREFASACAPVAYRGDQFPAEFRNNVFVCDPAVNIVKRNVIVEGDLSLDSRFGYERSEFLASTDERFRPVNLSDGPDGAFYVVDMYRGLVQHRIAITTHLRRETLLRDLEKPLHFGRIYRVVRADAKPTRNPKLSALPAAELVKLLAHPNGWTRDTAQRLLVERSDRAAVVDLAWTAATHTNPVTRVHALWTLEGIGLAHPSVFERAMTDLHPKVRLAAMRACDSLVRRGFFSAEQLPAPLARLTEDFQSEVRLQAAFSLGEYRAPEVFPAFAELLGREGRRPIFRDAVMSGLQGRELDFLGHLIANCPWIRPDNGMGIMLASLASAIAYERRPERMEGLLALTANQTGDNAWRAQSMLAGILEYSDDLSRQRIAFRAKPSSLDALLASPDEPIRLRTARVQRLLAWPGAEGYRAAPEAKPLSASEGKQFDQGKEMFTTVCAGCHGMDGRGLPALAPPLLRSEWVLGREQRLLAIVLGGIEGPINVGGKLYQPPQTLRDMPALGVLSDEQIAGVLTYIRREWGHAAGAVTTNAVAAARERLGERAVPFTEAELLKLE